MENLVVFSLFRDCSNRVFQYFNQFNALEWPYGKKIGVAVENDSKDNTQAMLTKYMDKTGYVLSYELGFPKHGSVISTERFRNLAYVANEGLNFIEENIKPEYVMFIESDLYFPPNLVEKLKKDVDQTNGIVAPMIFTAKDQIFYDIWAYRFLDSESFPAQHRKYFKGFSGLHQVFSAGSCLMFKGDLLAKGVRFTDESIVGFCKQAIKLGYKTYVNFDIDVVHPQ